MRVQRDIPARLIIGGVKKSNIRELVQQKLAKHGFRCQCIRCREVGHRMQVDKVKPDLSKIDIRTQCYEASGGKEFFIAAEDPINNILLGYLRMRIPSEKAHRLEITNVPSAIVRIHVYGNNWIGKRETAMQHRGYGKDLLARRNTLRITSLGWKSF